MRFWISWMFGLALMVVFVLWAFSQWNLRYYHGYISDRLELLSELRQGALEEYFNTAEAELRFWSRNEGVVRNLGELNAIWEEGGAQLPGELNRLYIEDNPNPAGFLLNLDDAGDGSAYSGLHARVHPGARLFVTKRGYYDFFMIGPQGDVYYSVEKESDFVTNLNTGPWRDSGLARVFQEASKGQRGKIVSISDMAAYGPSDGAAAIFMATAVHSQAGEYLGVLALQLPTDRIIGIMAYTSGMGESGETYLVGEDLLMRSDSRFVADSTVLSQRVETPAVKLALEGEQGSTVIEDYRGVPVLSAYLPLEVGKYRWAVLAEMDEAEVVQFAADERPSLSGALVLIYGLSLWSVWYWRGRRLPEDDFPGMSELDLPDGDGGGAA